METNILTPRELFQKDIRYMIPPFQRPYVWNQDEQWEPLWNDVRNLAEDCLEASETGGDISALEQTRRHFLGAVVIRLVQTATGDFEQREVIDGQQLLFQAHDFFKTQVRSWVEGHLHGITPTLKALETAATRLLQMVVIDLGQQDDPNIIFETLNARGTPLQQSDLIKNFVLSGNRDSNLWGDLDGKWWREEVRQGRLFRPRVDMLLNYWLAMRTGSDVAPSRVFDLYRRYYESNRIEDVMSDVKSDLAHYRQYEEKRGRNAEEELFHYRTSVMQVGVITPVLLLLLSDGVNQCARLRSFHILESFLIRRMVCRQTTKDYNRLILEMASELRKHDLDSADRVVAGFLRRQTAYARRWPSDQEVSESLESSPLYRLLTRGRLRLVLEGIEHRLRLSNKTEQQGVPKDLTMEHLMPQRWQGSWTPPDAEDQEAAEYERGKLIHSIGNLTLTTHSLNSSMSNAPWEDKRSELQKHSILLLNSALTNRPCWNEDSIRARSRQMAEWLSEYWPGPDSPDWES